MTWELLCELDAGAVQEHRGRNSCVEQKATYALHSNGHPVGHASRNKRYSLVAVASKKVRL